MSDFAGTRRLRFLFLALIAALPLSAAAAGSNDKPNIVLVLMDNFGWGEIGVYGGGVMRGAPMTGRYGIRTRQRPDGPPRGVWYGITEWETTLAEMLSESGYATAIFGKWHLGDTEGRYPTDQGFDEWIGIPRSSDRAFWPDSNSFTPDSHPDAVFTHVMSAKRGEKPKEHEVYGREKRKTGNGSFADVLAQTDDYVGDVLDTIDDLGLKDNAIVIFTSDNGREGVPRSFGFTGPWRSGMFSPYEGSLRVPFLIRWPGKIPEKRVSNEIVHAVDVLPTVASIIGAELPDDRVYDGADQTGFMMGKTDKSARESVVIYIGNVLFGVKWRNWKITKHRLKRTREHQTRSNGCCHCRMG